MAQTKWIFSCMVHGKNHYQYNKCLIMYELKQYTSMVRETVRLSFIVHGQFWKTIHIKKKLKLRHTKCCTIYNVETMSFSDTNHSRMRSKLSLSCQQGRTVRWERVAGCFVILPASYSLQCCIQYVCKVRWKYNIFNQTYITNAISVWCWCTNYLRTYLVYQRQKYIVLHCFVFMFG